MLTDIPQNNARNEFLYKKWLIYLALTDMQIYSEIKDKITLEFYYVYFLCPKITSDELKLMIKEFNENEDYKPRFDINLDGRLQRLLAVNKSYEIVDISIYHENKYQDIGGDPAYALGFNNCARDYDYSCKVTILINTNRGQELRTVYFGMGLSFKEKAETIPRRKSKKLKLCKSKKKWI